MGRFHEVEIRDGRNVLIDGEAMKGVCGVYFTDHVDTLPTVALELLANFSATARAEVVEEYTNEDLQTAARVMRTAIKNNPAVRDGFIASVASLLKRSRMGLTTEELAEVIVRRIAGED